MKISSDSRKRAFCFRVAKNACSFVFPKELFIAILGLLEPCYRIKQHFAKCSIVLEAVGSEILETMSEN